MVGDFSGEVLGSNRDRWKEVGKRTGFRNSKPVFHCLGGVASKEGGVTFRSNSPESLFVNASLIDVPGKLYFGFAQFLSGLETLMQLDTLLYDLLLPGLDGKVTLGKGNLIFSGVSILGNQVAGIASEHNIINGSFCTGTDSDHFRDVTKMVRNINPCCFAGCYG